MTFRAITIYDPAMCCSTGVCGPEVDPALVRFSADLDWIAKQGADVRRYNLAQEPAAFVREPTVREALQDEGEAALPLIVIEGRVVSRGRYPSREEIKGWVGRGEHGEGVRVLDAPAPEVDAKTAAGGRCGGPDDPRGLPSAHGSGCC